MLTRRDFFNVFNWIDSTGRPLADVHSDDEKFTIEVELPGIKAEDVDISVHEGSLTIRGERKYEKKGNDCERLERYYGSFVRSYSLPKSVDVDKIEAKSVDGVLTITVPKQEWTLPRKVKVLPEK